MVNARTIQMKWRGWLSVALCVAFVAGAIIGAGSYRSWQKMRQRDAFAPRQDMMALSRLRPNIVMLGDSHTELATWSELTGCPGVANFGISGNTSADIMARLPGVIAARPRVVFLMIGTNDILGGISLDDTASNVAQITQRLAAENVQVVIQAIPPLVGREKSVAALNARLKPTIEPPFTAADITSDRIHLRASGYAKWRDAAAPLIAMHCH